jgi:uncharacterized membrane protein
MMLPILCLKMYHNNPAIWSVGYQYNIEFASLTALAFISICESKIKFIHKRAIGIIVVSGCFAVSVRLMDNTEAYVDKKRVRVYQEQHFKSDFDIQKTYQLLGQFNSETKISCSTMFVPHLYNCKQVYQYPIVKDADYILIAVHNTTYPLTKKQLDASLIGLFLNKEWKLNQQVNNLYLFKKR